MKNVKKTISILVLSLVVLFTGCAPFEITEINVPEVYANASETVAQTSISSNTNASRRDGELRGIWIASVWNIDYPSSQTRDHTVLMAEAITMLDNIQDMGFNAIYLQVRPTADSLFPSELFPWSHWLTGTQGVAPTGGFDPLAFFIEESHKRGIELHAWLNPYRITAAVAENDRLSPDNPAVRYPELTILHTDGRLYFDPGNPAARQLIIDGIAEILRNYNVDGIHLDDYFYPSDTNGPFPDHATFVRYGAGFNSLADWRRHNTTELIRGIQEVVREIRPSAEFGVSPFGIWANRSTSPYGSNTRGNESYSRMFADTRQWVKHGYLDYIMPQLYWHIGFDVACYEVLLDWWTDVVDGTDVTLYIGLGAYRSVGVNPGNIWYEGAELRRQFDMNRQNNSVAGHVMFTYNSFMRVPALQPLMREVHAHETNVIRPGFPDIIGIPQRESIEYVASIGIIRGFDDGLFHPALNIRRGDFVLMLTRMFDIPIESGHPNFLDVEPGIYFYDEIATARALGLIYGVDGVNFAPNANITHQDLYVMAYRALDRMGSVSGQVDESILERYTDEAQIAYYARQAIAYFTEIGVFNTNTIRAEILINRANAAEFIANVVRAKEELQ